MSNQDYYQSKLAPRSVFVARVLRALLHAFTLVFLALLFGTIGYAYLNHLGWIDAFLNAAMILSGMGPVNTLTTDSAKLFAAFYALFSGLFFIVALGLIFVPVAHRLFKKLNLEDDFHIQKKMRAKK